MKLLATESNVGALFRMLGATWRGTLGQKPLDGVHFQQGDEIRIEGKRSNVILDGEIFEAKNGRSILLPSTQPVPFLRLAACRPPSVRYPRPRPRLARNAGPTPPPDNGPGDSGPPPRQ